MLLATLIRGEEAEDMIEYALLAMFVSIVAWAIVVSVGADVRTLYGPVIRGTTAAAASGS